MMIYVCVGVWGQDFYPTPLRIGISDTFDLVGTKHCSLHLTNCKIKVFLLVTEVNIRVRLRCSLALIRLIIVN